MPGEPRLNRGAQRPRRRAGHASTTAAVRGQGSGCVIVRPEHSSDLAARRERLVQNEGQSNARLKQSLAHNGQARLLVRVGQLLFGLEPLTRLWHLISCCRRQLALRRPIFDRTSHCRFAVFWCVEGGEVVAVGTKVKRILLSLYHSYADRTLRGRIVSWTVDGAPARCSHSRARPRETSLVCSAPHSWCTITQHPHLDLYKLLKRQACSACRQSSLGRISPPDCRHGPDPCRMFSRHLTTLCRSHE
jgi:hypothetical protein